jgi:hypothetical protein
MVMAQYVVPPSLAKSSLLILFADMPASYWATVAPTVSMNLPMQYTHLVNSLFYFALARTSGVFRSADGACLFHAFVAQISNLLYRRASSLRRVNTLRAAEDSTLCRLEIGDTAGWKPALRRLGAEFRAGEASEGACSCDGRCES